jgi:hypothetical protein
LLIRLIQMPSVGDVIGIKTKNVIGKDSAFKWYFCICARDRIYLYVCSRGYPGDFPITKKHCNGLEHETSYISVSRVIHVPDIKMRNATSACSVGDDFLRDLLGHVADLDVLSDADRGKITS